MLKDLVYNCRSYRRFYENVKISDAELKDLADLARLTASTANSQALKFRLVNTEEENSLVYPRLSWAGALPDWDGPEEGERPAAYIIIVEDGSLGNNKLIDTDHRPDHAFGSRGERLRRLYAGEYPESRPGESPGNRHGALQDSAGAGSRKTQRRSESGSCQ